MGALDEASTWRLEECLTGKYLEYFRLRSRPARLLASDARGDAQLSRSAGTKGGQKQVLDRSPLRTREDKSHVRVESASSTNTCRPAFDLRLQSFKVWYHNSFSTTWRLLAHSNRQEFESNLNEPELATATFRLEAPIIRTICKPCRDLTISSPTQPKKATRQHVSPVTTSNTILRSQDIFFVCKGC